MNLDRLPPEIVCHILRRLDLKTIHKMRLTSRRYNIIYQINQCRMPKPKVDISMDFDGSIIRIQIDLRTGLGKLCPSGNFAGTPSRTLATVIVNGRNLKKSDFDVDQLENYCIPYILSKESKKKIWETCSTNIYEDILKLWRTFDKYVSLGSLKIKSVVDDEALICMTNALSKNTGFELFFLRCALRIVDIGVWSRFLNKVQPAELSFVTCTIYSSPLFTKEIIESALKTTRNICFGMENSFEFGSRDGGIGLLFRLKSCEELYMHNNLTTPFDCIRFKINRWLKGECRIRRMNVCFASWDCGLAIKYFHACEGPDSTNDKKQPLRKELTNVKGETLTFIVHTIFCKISMIGYP